MSQSLKRIAPMLVTVALTFTVIAGTLFALTLSAASSGTTAASADVAVSSNPNEINAGGKMPRSSLLAACLLAAATAACGLSAWSSRSITGSGTVIAVNKELADFSRVEISHSFDVTIRQGDSYAVVVRCDDNIEQYLHVNKNGRTLEIGLDQGVSIRNGTLQAEIRMPALSAIEASGASHATLTGFESEGDLQIEASGASSVKGDIKAGSVNVQASGASSVKGDIRASNVNVQASGASRIALDGGGENLVLNLSGASSADLEDYPVSGATADLSGASGASVNVRGTLDVDASGASHLTYLGHPTIRRANTSGASTIKAK